MARLETSGGTLEADKPRQVRPLHLRPRLLAACRRPVIAHLSERRQTYFTLTVGAVVLTQLTQVVAHAPDCRRPMLFALLPTSKLQKCRQRFRFKAGGGNGITNKDDGKWPTTNILILSVKLAQHLSTPKKTTGVALA